MEILNIPRAIYLYNEGIEKINFKELKDFIRQNFGLGRVFVVRAPKKLVFTKGLLFDFLATAQAFASAKYAEIRDACHIILTPKIFATVADQKRVHIRAAIFSYPSVISSAGIVEGPAKPKEYYLYKQKYAQLGTWGIEEARIKQKFKHRFIDYQDKKIAEVLNGYIAQGLFFYITGEPFCKRKACRLYNAHWQEDLIYSQIKHAKFCLMHKRTLDKIRKFDLT